MAPILLPIKTINTNGADLIYTVTYNEIELMTATGYTSIDEGYSLTVEVSTNQDTPMFIGVKLYSLDRAITVADRIHIGFLPANSTVVLSPASVPQLADIHWHTRQIDIIIYTFQRAVAGGTTITIAPRIDVPNIGISAQTYIGRDSAALTAKQYSSLDSGIVLFPAASNGVLITTTATDPHRYRIRSVSITLWPTTYIAELQALIRVQSLGFGSLTIARFWSGDKTIEHFDYYPNTILEIGETLDVYVENSNSAEDFNLSASAFIEVIY